jgi:hypothetical protein
MISKMKRNLEKAFVLPAKYSENQFFIILSHTLNNNPTKENLYS